MTDNEIFRKSCEVIVAVVVILLALSFPCFAGHFSGNTYEDSFPKTTKRMASGVYESLPHKTLYCQATFSGRVITDPNGFYSDKYKKRGEKMEWEHVVPAENFGRAFPEWRDGSASCVTRKGKSYKGRRCATKTSQEYRYMQADMYNIYPSIGAVNALRSNYRYGMVDGHMLGTCPMIIKSRKAQPPEYARGIVARINLYFDAVYPKYTLSNSHKQLFDAWNSMYPVTNVECSRNLLIEGIQGNINQITKDACDSANP